MRSFSWIICLPLALLIGCAAGSSKPQGVHTVTSGPTWEVTGYGESVGDAREQALEKARNSVEEYLEKHYPSIGWRPRIQTLLAESIVRLDDPKQGDFAERPAYEVTSHIDLREANLGKLQTEVDQAREQAQENAIFWRHLLVGRILAGLVALFLIVSGYLRLEELTRGYYTTLLRVGAGAVLLLIVAMVVIV